MLVDIILKKHFPQSWQSPPDTIEEEERKYSMDDKLIGSMSCRFFRNCCE